MGGSGGGRGGGSYFNSDPKLADQKLKAAQSKTDDATYTTDCNVALNDLLANYNNRDADAHLTLLAEIKDTSELKSRAQSMFVLPDPRLRRLPRTSMGLATSIRL